MKRLLLVVAEVALYLTAGTACLAAAADLVAPTPTPVVAAPQRATTTGSAQTTGTTQVTGTVYESACVEGYLPDGTWFACP